MPEIAGVYRASSRALVDRPALPPKTLPLGEAFQPGQLLELSGTAPGKLSAVLRLMLRAQAASEPIAYVALRSADGFYPPDVAEAGVDLAALVCVRLPDTASAQGLVRAAEILLRSGAFGLVVVDLEQGAPRGELAWQTRLSGLARAHDARVVLLTRSGTRQASLGPLVALRVTPTWQARGDAALLTPHVLKSKLGGPSALSPDVRTFPCGAV